MRLVRLALAAAACVAALLVIARHNVVRYQCSAEKKRSELWMQSARESSLEQRLAVARGAIPRLVRCAESDPSDHEALFLLGAAQSEAGQPESALRAFQAALALNERPETYARIGILHLEAGRVAEARRNLEKAAFFNLPLLTSTLDPDTAWEMSYAAQQRRKRLLEKKRNSGS